MFTLLSPPFPWNSKCSLSSENRYLDGEMRENVTLHDEEGESAFALNVMLILMTNSCGKFSPFLLLISPFLSPFLKVHLHPFIQFQGKRENGDGKP